MDIYASLTHLIYSVSRQNIKLEALQQESYCYCSSVKYNCLRCTKYEQITRLLILCSLDFVKPSSVTLMLSGVANNYFQRLMLPGE